MLAKKYRFFSTENECCFVCETSIARIILNLEIQDSLEPKSATEDVESWTQKNQFSANRNNFSVFFNSYIGEKHRCLKKKKVSSV